MTVLATIAFAAFLLEDDNLVALYEGSEHFTNYFGAVNCRSANLYRTVGFSEEHTVKLNLLSFFDSFAEIVDIQELLASALNCCP